MYLSIKKSFVLLSVVFVSACSSIEYHGLIPDNPTPSVAAGLTGPRFVDSLQPTLSWKTEGLPTDSKFDLIIYSAINNNSRSLGGQYCYLIHLNKGVEIYYREGLDGSSHKVEMKLEPKTIYFWSVRTRKGSETAPWSTFDYETGIRFVTRWEKGSKREWLFMTP